MPLSGINPFGQTARAFYNTCLPGVVAENLGQLAAVHNDDALHGGISSEAEPPPCGKDPARVVSKRVHPDLVVFGPLVKVGWQTKENRNLLVFNGLVELHPLSDH